MDAPLKVMLFCASDSPELPPGAGSGASPGTADLVPRSYSQTGGSAAAGEGRRLLGEEEPRETWIRPVCAVAWRLQTFPHSEQRRKQICSTLTGQFALIPEPTSVFDLCQ